MPKFTLSDLNLEYVSYNNVQSNLVITNYLGLAILGDLRKRKEKMPNIENSTLLNNAETKKPLHTKVLKSFYKTLSKLKEWG